MSRTSPLRSPVVGVASAPARSTLPSTLRSTTRVAALTAALVAAAAVTAPAQSIPSTRPAGIEAPTGFEFRPYVGAFVPTGDQRDLLKDAVFTGAQLGYHFTRNVALTGTFGWSPSKDRTGAPGLVAPIAGRGPGEQKLDVYQYDLAVEGRLPAAVTFGDTRPWHVSPFAALGAGGRTYNYRDLDGANSQTQFVGLGALGVEIGPVNSPVSLRLEARDYVSAFKGLRGERADRVARNDLTFAAGLTVGFGGRRDALR